MTLTISTVPTVAELQSYKIIAEVTASNEYWRKLGGKGSQESIVSTILSIMLLARELGISPIQAISGGIHNINGKFEISARLMNQLIRKHGHKIAIKISTDKICSIWSKRKDTGEEWEQSFSIEEAQLAGLIREGSPWKKCPSDMLFARCISRIARRLYADCIAGAYVEGELQESINGTSQSVDSLEDLSKLKNEIEVKVEEEIELKFPEHIDHQEALFFLEESAKTSNTSIVKAKERAFKNMSGFVDAFIAYKEKQQQKTIETLPKDEFENMSLEQEMLA